MQAAIALLDAEGEDGLTFRALAARLSTGAGAIYWHVANKDELLIAASNAVLAQALGAVVAYADPRKAIRRVALRVFEAVDAHPWICAQLPRDPWQAAMLQVFERIGRQVQALGVPDRALFTAASALVNYIVGVSGQNAANARAGAATVAVARASVAVRPQGTASNRAYLLETVSARWQDLDPREYPFARKIAAQLRKHDDRAEFLAGIDLILAGIAASF